MLLRSAVLSLVALVFSIDASAQAPPEACAADHQQRWETAYGHFSEGRLDEAVAGLDPLVADCEDHPLGYFPRLLRADIALSKSEPATASALIADIPLPLETSALLPFAWMKMQASLANGELEAFRAERGRLVAATETALTEPDNWANSTLKERWSTEDYDVSAFELSLLQDMFLRKYLFVLTPKADAPPISVAVTNSLGLGLLFDGPTEFALDLYSCSTHATLDWIRASGKGEKAKLSYKKARKAIDTWLAGQTDAITASTQNAGALCNYAPFITPLPDPPEDS